MQDMQEDIHSEYVLPPLHSVNKADLPVHDIPERLLAV